MFLENVAPHLIRNMFFFEELSFPKLPYVLTHPAGLFIPEKNTIPERLGTSLGCLGTHFESTWGCIEVSWGCLWITFWTPWARCWDAWGSFYAILDIWCPQEPPPQADSSQVPPAHKNKPPEICPGVPAVPAVPAKRSMNYSSGPLFHTRRGSG